MDTTAHRILKQARDLLVDGLGLYRIDIFPAEPGPHGMDTTQRAQVVEATQLLWRLLSDDPSPPECQECATPITQPPTGRPRLYCSDACRSAAARGRALAERDLASRPDHDPWGTGLKDGGF